MDATVSQRGLLPQEPLLAPVVLALKGEAAPHGHLLSKRVDKGLGAVVELHSTGADDGAILRQRGQGRGLLILVGGEIDIPEMLGPFVEIHCGGRLSLRGPPPRLRGAVERARNDVESGRIRPV